MDNYNHLVLRISESAKISQEEVERKIEAKRAKLSGLVSREGAAQIVAAELGINFEKERMKISELVEGMKKANLLGKVIEIGKIREFNKNGREGKVGSFTLADESSNTRVVLWDTNHISLIETGKINEGDVVSVSNGNVRNGEVHLSSFGDLKISNEKMENVKADKEINAGSIKDAKAGQVTRTRAFIVQAFEPRYFEVCPECGKRALEGECKVHGKVEGVKKALMNIVLDDGTESVRAVLFGEQIKNLGFTDEEIFNLEVFNAKKATILGEEKIFTGNLRNNQLYNNLELSVEQINEVNVDELINELEGRANIS